VAATRAQTRNIEIFERIKHSVAGGESSYVRIMAGNLPTVIVGGRGSRMYDADGAEYIDYNLAHGPLFLGHRPEVVERAVVEQITQHGSMYGFPHELDYQVGELMQSLVPGLGSVRFANSGTEAVAAAVRLARAFTGRDLIVRFEGHYHGWSEAVFAKEHPPLELAGPEDEPKPVPGTPGMSPHALDSIVMCAWNRIDLLEKAFERHPGKIALVVMEPVNFNTGALPPEPGYLAAVRELTRREGALLLFDEVQTGFRIDSGGATTLYGVTPDLWTWGKAIGAGYSTAAFGGSHEVMQLEADNTVFHGGTYAGNPVALAAARAVLTFIKEKGPALYEGLSARTERLGRGLERILKEAGYNALYQGVGPQFQVYVCKEPVTKLINYREAARVIAPDLFMSWQHAMQRAGVYFHPRPYDRWSVSVAHTDADIDKTLEITEQVVTKGFEDQ
jgi:glutamate-1-semialdehyde 2,1-aminomutase